jgi:hypothetical protein
MICLLLLSLIVIATGINKKITSTERKYMWISIFILAVSASAYPKREGFQNNNATEYDQIIMSEPYNTTGVNTTTDETKTTNNTQAVKANNTVKANNAVKANNTVKANNAVKSNNAVNTQAVKANNAVKVNNAVNAVKVNNAVNTVKVNNAVNTEVKDNTELYWFHNALMTSATGNIDGLSDKEYENGVKGFGPLVYDVEKGELSNPDGTRDNFPLELIEFENNIKSEVANYNMTSNDGVLGEHNNSVHNENHDMKRRFNQLSSNVSNIKNTISNLQTSMINSNTVKDVLTEQRIKEVDYSKVEQAPHIPSVAQYGTKGVSNIFTPQIIIRKPKKDAGGVSYNHHKDMYERGFPNVEFEVKNGNSSRTGKIVREKEPKMRDWQEPEHDLWDSSNIASNVTHKSSLMGSNALWYHSSFTQADGSSNAGFSDQEYENGVKGVGPLYYSLQDDMMLNSNGSRDGVPLEVIEYENKMKLSMMQDPLDNMKENMQASNAFKQNQKKSCTEHVEKYRNDDEERLVREAIKNNTWKKFRPGYSMVDPNKWDVPQKRPPACLPDTVKLPSAVQLGGVSLNVLELDSYGQIANTEETVTQTNVGSMLPKFKYTEYQN